MDGKMESSFDYANMDSSSESIDCRVLKDGENSVNAEWSATTSTLNLSDTSISNSYISIQTLKECCGNLSGTLKDKKDFMVVDSTFTTATNLTYSGADDTNFSSVQTTMAFQTKHKSDHNYSLAFENILDDESQMEETLNTLCLNNFQKHKKNSNFNSVDFSDNFDTTKSNGSEMYNVEERIKSSKLRFSKKNKIQSCSEILDFNFSIPKNSLIADDANISKRNFIFEQSSDFSLVNNNSTIDAGTSKELNLKFTHQIVDYVASAFDDVVNDSSMTSNANVNNRETSSSNLSFLPVDRPSLCSTIKLNLNQTNDVPSNCNSTKIGSLSQSLKNNIEVTNGSIEQPINIAYNVENDLTSSKSTNNVSLGSVNIKCMKDTYTVECNLRETFEQKKSGLKSVSNTKNILTDMSNIISQSELPIREYNSIHKQQLNKVPRDSIKIHDTDNNTTLNCEMYETDNNKLKRKSNGADSNIMSSQGNKVSFENTKVSNNVFSNMLNIPTDTLNYDSYNISLKCNKNEEDLTNTSSTQPSNLILHAANENDLNLLVMNTLPNTSNNSLHYKSKFNFNKQLDRQSLSYHENSMNLTVKNLQNTSLNTSLLKIPIYVTNCYNKVSKKLDNNCDLRSLSLKIQKHYPNSQEVLKPLSDSYPFVSNTLSNEEYTLNTTFNPSSSSDFHFTGKYNSQVNSMVFNDLVDSLNSNTSINVTKQVTFKASNNIPNEYHSAIFDGLLTNSQEFNSTLTQNKLSNDSKLSVLGDELSIFANTEELFSNSKSIIHSNCSFEKLENNFSKTLSLEKQNCSKDEFNSSKNKCFNENTLKLPNIATFNKKSYDMEITKLKNLSGSNNSEPICLSNETSSKFHNSFSSKISYCNDELPLVSNSTGSSKNKRKSNEIDGLEISNITQNSPKKNKLISITEIKLCSVSVDNDKTLTEHKSIISTNNVNHLSTYTPGTSETKANSVNENIKDESIFCTNLLSESFTNTSATDNVIENENQALGNNKQILIKHIIFKKVEKMCVHKQKPTHPGAFELDDPGLLVSFESSLCHSSSFITRMLAENKNSELTLSPQSNSVSFVQLLQDEETVNKKFKSLYKKESWITKRLYHFLVSKLKPKYNIYSVKNTEVFVMYLASILRQIYQKREDLQLYSDILRFQMARYEIINNTADYIQFLTDFIPNPYYNLLVPGWNLKTSPVKFEPTRYYFPIMEDEEFLQKVSAYLDNA